MTGTIIGLAGLLTVAGASLASTPVQAQGYKPVCSGGQQAVNMGGRWTCASQRPTGVGSPCRYPARMVWSGSGWKCYG